MITAAQFRRAQMQQMRRMQAKEQPLRATMGAPDGTIQIPNRPGYVWAQLGGAIVAVRNTTTQTALGLPILLENDPFDSAGFTVKSANYAAIESWDGNNYTQVNVSPNTNPAYVDQSGILVGLPLATSPASNAVYIPAFYYWSTSGLTAFAAVTTTTLLGSLPAAAYSKWVTVSVDISSNAYALTVGSDFANDDATPTAYFPAVPSGDFILADVRIESSTTAISQNMIYGLRRALVDTGVSTVGTGFNRLITGDVALGAEQSVVISRYITITTGASLTIATGAQLQMIL